MAYQTTGNGLTQLSGIWTNRWYELALLVLLLVLLTGCGGQAASAAKPTSTAASALAAPTLVSTNTVPAPMLLFVTPPPVRAEEPLSPDSRNIPSVFEGINEYYAVQATLMSVDQPPSPAADPAAAARAVVQILRCDDFGCETPAGSGVIVHPSGLILTAYHVLLTDAEDPNAARYLDFVIAMTENPRTAPQPRYRARLVASKADQDLALLAIDRTLETVALDSNTLSLPALPLADVTTLFADDLHVLGYPVTGGEAISYVRVGFRSFDDNGRLIVVDQALDPGNSGGPALLLREGRLAIAGLVIRRRSTQGQLSQQGLVRAIDQFNTLTWTPHVPRAWGENVHAQTQGSAANASLQLALTLNTIDLVGQPLRLLFYATDAATDQPWRPVGMNAPLVVWTDVEPQAVIARQTLTLTVPVESLGVMPDRLRFRALLWDRDEGETLWVDPTGVQVSVQVVDLANTVTPTQTPIRAAMATPLPTATPPYDPRLAYNLSTLIEGHVSQVNSVSWSPDDTKLVSGSSDNNVRIWNSETGMLLHILKGHTGSVNSVAWSADGIHIASGAHDNTVRVWDGETGMLLHILEGHTDSVNSVAWSADGMYIASGARDNTVRVWDGETGMLLHILEGHMDSVNSVAWSTTGMHIASGDNDTRLCVWDGGTGVLLYSQYDGHGPVFAVAWSADGTRIISSNPDNMRILDGETGAELGTLPDPWVRAVAWSADGAHIASASDENTVRLWDAGSGETLATLQGHTDSVRSVSWSPDGSQLASASADGTVRIWRVD